MMAEENAGGTRIEPLFPVALDFEIPDAAETFAEVKRLILENYYHESISEEALYWAAIQGMLRRISPPDDPELSRIWTASEYERILSSLEGVDVSLGIRSTFNQAEGSLTVTEIEPEAPSADILRVRDRILRIDGEALRGKEVAEVNRLLAGEAGSEVTLTINRDIRVFEVRLTRERFNTRQLHIHRLNHEIALMEIRSFPQGISEKIEREARKLKEDGVRALILDVRNNGGGVFSEGLRTANLFVQAQGIVLRTFSQAERLQNYVSGAEEPLDFHIALLINNSSASASEMLVGALRDQLGAFVVGHRSHGKGVFERTFTLENEFRVKFITGVMYTPKGVPWQGRGLTPDYLVEQDAETVNALRRLDIETRYPRDVALVTAVKLLELRLQAE